MRVYLLHGVGMWPGLFDSVRTQLTVPTTTWARPGYGGEAVAADLDEQLQSLADAVAAGGPGVLVGVSGGATLALAAAIERVAGVGAIVTHEPLVGSLVPELDTRIAAAADGLVDADAATIDSFLAELYGDGWRTRPGPAVTWTARHRQVVPQDVVGFATFQPTRGELEALSIPHLTTVGSASGPERHRVAEVLAECGARRATVPDSGHLVVTDNPAGFAAVLSSFLAEEVHA